MVSAHAKLFCPSDRLLVPSANTIGGREVDPAPPPNGFDPALSAALERTEDAAAHITEVQAYLWQLAKKDAAFGDIALQLSGLLGSIEARRHSLEEEAGV